MIALDTNATAELLRLNTALGKVQAIGRRSGAELIRRAASDIILGSRGTGSGSGAFFGLYDEFTLVAPDEGEATRSAASRDWRMADDSSSFVRGLAKARSVLGSEDSGVFVVERGSGGRVFTPRRVLVRTRGKSAGQFVAEGRGRKRSASAVNARGGDALGALRRTSQAEFYRRRGYSILNLQALAVAYALAYREAARGSVAAQFLAKRYRRILVRKAGYDYTKGGMARGVSSVDLAMTHEHRRELIQNKGGRVIGSLDLDLGEQASARIVGALGEPTRHSQIVRRVLAAVALDRESYLIGRAMRQTISNR